MAPILIGFLLSQALQGRPIELNKAQTWRDFGNYMVAYAICAVLFIVAACLYFQFSS